MITKAQKQASINKILNSDEFKDSSIYKELLLYLYKESQQGEPPKELTIAQEVFGQKEFNAEKDAKIRVYVYNLRKKLNNYYLREGKEDPLRLTIPKGHYVVNFSEHTQKDSQRKFSRTLVIYAIILLSILAVNIYFWLRIENQQRVRQNELINDPIWSDFFESNLSTMIVFGDYFLYEDTLSSYRPFIRNPQINSIVDFNHFLELNPQRKNRYAYTSHTFLGKFTVWCFNNIIRVFRNTNTNIELQLASNLQWHDFQENNIIFIGSFKTLRIMKNYMANVHFDYQVYPNTLFYYDEEKDSTYSYHAPKIKETGFIKDYVLVTLLPGPNRNTIITFSSTHDIGHISVVESFTNPDFLRQFNETYLSGRKSKFFEAVFEVQGFERTGFHPRLFHYNELSADYDFTRP
jgi:hypothetical protein